MTTDDEIRLADGRTPREIHDEELEADLRVERRMLAKEALALSIVILVVVARQLWFV